MAKRTIVYIDGFNLYYRALKGGAHRWLNLKALCEAVLPGDCEVVAINYYTARVSARVSATAPRDQNTYLKALSTLPCVSVHLGDFQVQDKWAYLSPPPRFKPPTITAAVPVPEFACIVKTEEKGSDVNLAAHLVRDAFMGKFDQAAILTNDTDLAEPIRIVRQEANLPVTLMTPVMRPSGKLKALASSVRHIEAYLGVSQFPPQLDIPGDGTIERPEGW